MKLVLKAVMAGSVMISSGCAVLPPSPATTPPAPPASSGELQTVIMPTGASYDEALAFQVNRAAYAAVFRIVPGQGAMMIYPRPGFGARDGYLFSGFHRIAGGAGSSFATSLDGGMGPGWQAGVAGPESGPEYYFVVVSERPFRMDGRMYGPGGWMQSGGSGPETMSWIVSQIVPDPRAADWTTDYYVHWPETISTAAGSGLIPLTCDGKRVWANPEQYDRAVSALCGRGADSQGPGRPRPVASDPIVADPSGAAGPPRRDPLPADAEPTAGRERIASRQLQEPEAWEQARSTLAERRRPAVPAELISPDPSSRPAAQSDIERILRDAEQAGIPIDAIVPMLDSPVGRVRPNSQGIDEELMRPGFEPPRVRPTFEVAPPPPVPSLDGSSPSVDDPAPQPMPATRERAPVDSGAGEGVTRTRPGLE